MKFDLHARKVVPDVTGNAVLTVLLAAKENLAAIDRHVKVKGDLLADVDRDAAKDLRADLKAVRWAHRVLNASWKMRCGLMPTPMESSAKKS